ALTPAQPAPAPAPAAPPPVTVAEPMTKPAPGPSAAPPPAPDACHVSEQLTLAYDALKPETRKAQWVAEAQAKLLIQEDAERAFTGIAQEVVSALAHKNYGKLTAFAPADGICLRPAKGAPCQNVSPRQLTACSASAIRSPWAVDDSHGDAPRYSC